MRMFLLFYLGSLSFYSTLTNAQPVTVEATLSTNNPTYSAPYSGQDVVFIEIEHSGGFFLVDTKGANFNTYVGLYNSEGSAIGMNNIDFEFGITERQSAIGFLDGLQAGTYYLAVRVPAKTA
jgi:hypothetical protein